MYSPPADWPLPKPLYANNKKKIKCINLWAKPVPQFGGYASPVGSDL